MIYKELVTNYIGILTFEIQNYGEGNEKDQDH